MGRRKTFIGTVTSAKMQKTCVVKVTHLAKHAKYGKVMKKFNKFKVHDEEGIAKLGDLVSIEETRPLSKDKHFRLVKVVKAAPVHQVEIKEEII
jgi:small subunit ribosomal protein S17